MATGGVSDMEKGTDETFGFLCSICKAKNKNTEGDQFYVDCHGYYCSTCVKLQQVTQTHTRGESSESRSKSTAHESLPQVTQTHTRGESSESRSMATTLESIPQVTQTHTRGESSESRSKSTAHESLPQVTQTHTRGESSESRSMATTLESLPQVTQTHTRGESSESHSMATALESLPQLTQTHTRGESWESHSKATALESLPQLTQTHTRGESWESHSMATALESLPQITQTHTRGESWESHSMATAQESLPQVSQTRTSNTPYGSEVTKAQTTDKSSPSPVTIIQSRNKSSSSQSTPSLLQIKSKKRYTVKVKSDSETCKIFGACILADGTIILSDYTNKKLKRVNTTSYTVTDYCEVPDSPCQVCAITDQEVAVACYYSRLIQFVSIGRTMQKTRKINIGFQCSVLAYADEKLFVCNSHLMYVYSVSGYRQQQLRYSIFSGISSLAFSSDHSKIYISDCYSGLIILDKTYQLVEQFTCHNYPELIFANGVCLYSKDRVLVCANGSLLQFSLDGKLVGEVLKTDGHFQTVCCNKDNSNLIVGFFDNVGDEDDDIEVYHVSS